MGRARKCRSAIADPGRFIGTKPNPSNQQAFHSEIAGSCERQGIGLLTFSAQWRVIER